MDLCFIVHKLEKFPSNLGKLHFEILVHLLRYIRDNKTLELIYYAKIEDELLYGFLIHARINIDNQLMLLSYSI